MKIKYVSIYLIFLMCAASSPVRSAAQTSEIDENLASQYFLEARQICNRDGGKLWGVSLCAPLLFVDPKTRIVVANQADKEGNLTKEADVFVGKLPTKINVANTSIEWAGVEWAMIILPLPADKFRRADLMIHESWHRVQDEIGFPGSGAGNNHLDSRDGRIWLQLEWRALAAALGGRGKARRRAIEDALLFRARRREIFPNAAAEERAMEMHEGLAEYTGVKLGSANPARYVIDANLKDAPSRETFVRSFAYASGPAYGILLDESKANWRKGLKKEDDLGVLLQRKFFIKLSSNIKQTAENRAVIYDGDKLQAFETERENNRRKVVAEYRAKLVDGAVLALPLIKMNMQINPGNLVPLASFGTVYPTIRVVDSWGILTASQGALINTDFSKIYVSAPPEASASPIRGSGWTLELSEGWTLAVGERAGDYVVKKLK